MRFSLPKIVVVTVHKVALFLHIQQKKQDRWS